MKTRLPRLLSLVLAVALVALAMLTLHRSAFACPASLEHCLIVADASTPAPSSTLEPVSTATPIAVPTDAGAMLTDGEDAAKAFATKDYPYAVGLFLFLLIGAYEKYGTNVIPQKDRILVVLAIPAVGALAGALVMHKPVLASLALAGETLGGTFLAEGGIALLPALKAALGIGAAAKPAGA